MSPLLSSPGKLTFYNGFAFALAIGTVCQAALVLDVPRTLTFEGIVAEGEASPSAESTAGGDFNPLFYQGFSFSATPQLFAISHGYQSALTINTGSDYLLIQGGLAPRVTMSMPAGTSFALQGFGAEMSPLGGASSATLTIDGRFASGALISTTVTLTSSYRTFNLPATWTNLSQVTFTASERWWGLDNVRVLVPEPSSAMLFCSGICALVTRRRR